MHKCSISADDRRRGRNPRQTSARISLWGVRRATALLAVLLLLQAGCFLHRHKPAAADLPSQSVRIALLPINTPSENADLRWLSLAAPIMMAKTGESAPDLEFVPLWESIPVALEAIGSSRSITSDQAAFIASRLTAKWAIMGEIAPAKDGITLLIDFIPSKESMIAFRYEKKTDVISLEGNFREAFEQFLRYLVVRPLGNDSRIQETASLRELAEALDLENGWFVAAEPGKSEKIVSRLSQSDNNLAQVLFNPNLYPGISRTPPAGSQEKKPAGDPTPDKATTPPPAPATPPPRAAIPPPDQTEPPAAATSSATRIELLPPQTVTSAEIIAGILPTEPTRAARSEALSPPRKSSISRGAAPSPATEKPAVVESPRQEQKDRPPASAIHLPRTDSQRGQAGTSSKTARGQFPLIKRGLDSGFVIQVFATPHKEVADAIAARLGAEGLKPQIKQVDLGEKGVWFRIRLENFKSREEAVAQGERLRTAGLIKDYWLIR